MGKSNLNTLSTKFQGQTKLATAIFIITICFYFFFFSHADDQPPSEEHSSLLSTAQKGVDGNTLRFNDMAQKDRIEKDDLLQIKVIPADLADESLDLLPKESFSYACVIGKE